VISGRAAAALRCATLRRIALAGALLLSPIAAKGAPFPVIGYFPSWTGADPARIDFAKLTQVNYAFINPTAAGGLTEVNGPVMSTLSAEARKHGVKVFVAIGGWSDWKNDHWEGMAKRPKTRARFVANVLEFCDLYRLDGVDIDWEYPNAASADDYASMLKELGEALHQGGRTLSAAVVAKDDDGNAAHVHADVFAAIDRLNIMAYDWNYGKVGVSHSSFGLADSALAYWLKRGCPKDKAVLGVPFYGRMPETAYREILGHDPQASQKDSSGALWYNGVPTMKKKTELALRKAGGIMIWEITQDVSGEGSLLGAIDATVRSGLR
jgi:chitinase